jgi:hypothetical protein
VTGYLNDYEVEDAERVFHLDGLPNLYRGAAVIHALMDYANANSDGWHMWKAPRKAASGLIDVVDDARRNHLRGHLFGDITDEQLKGLLRPVKSFLTRDKVDQDELPWAALFPLT